jgi:hypothetical protein
MGKKIVSVDREVVLSKLKHNESFDAELETVFALTV